MHKNVSIPLCLFSYVCVSRLCTFDPLVLVYSGMYEASARFADSVGIPAKSGVSGCIWAVIPNVCGIAIYSPPVDAVGNSVRGFAVLRELSALLHFNLFEHACGVGSGFGIQPAEPAPKPYHSFSTKAQP
jgi:hypothetical protein